MILNRNEKSPRWIIFILALGYMIDFFDLTVFAVVRRPALQALGISAQNPSFISVSAMMFNAQAIGIVCGGVLSGIWGDKLGRLSAVRAGILLYSLAILANAFVTTVPAFAFFRFLAGVGLAGEFAASVTLLTEMIPAQERGLAGGIVYSCGVIGGFLATFIGAYFQWQVLFIVGGTAGLLILLARMSFGDSLLYREMEKQPHLPRGNLRLLLTQKSSVFKLIFLILTIIPFWFMAFFVNFAPEIAKEIHMKEPASQSLSLAFYFLGAFAGAYLFSYIAKIMKSRKAAVIFALILMVTAIAAFYTGLSLTPSTFYIILLFIGLASGYPGIFMVIAAESFGTNQRTTATSIISSAGRCSLVGVNAFVPWMVLQFTNMTTGLFLSSIIFLMIGIISLFFIKETHNISLNYHENFDGF